MVKVNFLKEFIGEFSYISKLIIIINKKQIYTYTQNEN